MKNKHEIHFLQMTAFHLYLKICSIINEAPRMDIIDLIYNCEDITTLDKMVAGLEEQYDKL